MKRMLRQIASYITRLVPPRVSEYLITQLEHNVGIGSGGDASRSGERTVFDALVAICEGKIVVFDVGANKGQYANELLSSIGKSRELEVHCFEPSRKTFELLSTNVGSDHRITLNNFGLADKQKLSSLFMNEEGSGLASLTHRKLDHFGIDHGRIREQVELRTLDIYCRENNVNKIDLLKIDVEGHELDVLAGASSVLKEERISLVQFEFGGCNIDTKTYFQDFYYLFESMDFELYRVLPTHSLLKVSQYRETDEKFRTMNFLAARKDVQLSSRFSRTR